MTFLIDGYNLMHAVGLLGPTRAAGQLRPARARFLAWLAGAAEGRAAVLRVVFDAEKGKGGAPAEADHYGVKVRFALRRTADDEIEDLLAAAPHPDRLTVVSNDARLQEAARRRGAVAHTCQQFVDWLIETPVAADPEPTTNPSEPEKPAPAATPDEMAAWLAAFSAPKPKPKPR